MVLVVLDIVVFGIIELVIDNLVEDSRGGVSCIQYTTCSCQSM